MKMEEPLKPKTLIEHYDEAYLGNPNFFWGGKPEASVLQAADLVSPGGNVIEFGAGQGRNVLPLAERGFDVTAIDVSKVGVDSINRIAQERGLTHLRAEVKDSREGIKGEFDLIVSTFMLQHLSRVEAEKFIEEIKRHTKENGINVLVVFTDTGDTPHHLEDRFYPISREMPKFYGGWEIIKYNEEKVELADTKPGGGSTFSIKAEIIARKPA